MTFSAEKRPASYTYLYYTNYSNDVARRAATRVCENFKIVPMAQISTIKIFQWRRRDCALFFPPPRQTDRKRRIGESNFRAVETTSGNADEIGQRDESG